MTEQELLLQIESDMGQEKLKQFKLTPWTILVELELIQREFSPAKELEEIWSEEFASFYKTGMDTFNSGYLRGVPGQILFEN